MSLTPPEKLQKLQAALHAKAKASPDQRFHALYDKVYRKDVLEHAYDCCRANGGAEGVDGQKFEDIEKYGLGQWLDELAEELKVKTFDFLGYTFGRHRSARTGRWMFWWQTEQETHRGCARKIQRNADGPETR